jgi:hypothetical protein
MYKRIATFIIGGLSILAVVGGILLSVWDFIYVGYVGWKARLLLAVIAAVITRYWLMNTGQTPHQRWVGSWRQRATLTAAVLVLVWVTQWLWMPLLAPLVKQVARNPHMNPSLRGAAWEFVSRGAMAAKDREPLLAVATDTSAPGEVRAKAWVALAQRWEQAGDLAKAADGYVAALDCFVSDPDLTLEGTILRNEVWNQLRPRWPTMLDPQRYRTVLVSLAERTHDQSWLEELMFELGKLKLLAPQSRDGGETEIKP